MDVTSWLETRIDPSPVTAALAIGDGLAILTFVVAGELNHGYDPIADAGRVVGTLGPFLVGWAIVAIAWGLYTENATSGLRRMIALTVPAWTVAVVLAQLLRATSFFHGDASLSFAIVSVGIGSALLLGWRVLASVARPQRGGPADGQNAS